MSKMLKLLCVCFVFVANCVNAYHYYGFENNTAAETTINPNDEQVKRKMLSYFEQSWEEGESKAMSRPTFQASVNIIPGATIQTTYRTEFKVRQTTYPYLYKIMQMFPIKGQVSFQFVYEKLFKYYIVQKKFNVLNKQTIMEILYLVFPELGNQLNILANYPIGPEMFRILFEMVFPQWPKHDLDMIFSTPNLSEVLLNLILYLCPNIRDHFLWKENVPIHVKLNVIFKILFPGFSDSFISTLFSLQYGYKQVINRFLDALFNEKLILSKNEEVKPEGPEWYKFQQTLDQQHINVQQLPQDVIWHLFANFKTPEFKIYVVNLKEKMKEQNKPPTMDNETLKIWNTYLVDLKSRQKTLNDMPPKIKLFIQKYDNPKEFIQVLSQINGFPIDETQLNVQLNPEIMNLWKKFIFDVLDHKGDTTHFPKELLNYFYTLSNSPEYLKYVDTIFDSLSINPKIAIQWNTFFDEVQNGKVTLDQMPTDLTQFLTRQQHPQEFLRIIMKLKDSKTDTSFLNINFNPQMLQMWQKFIKDVASNKGNLQDIPPELLQYFGQISSNPTYTNYLKLVFAPDQIKPATLGIWNQFIDDLKHHRVDLKDIPSEIIQLMLKYKNPNDFFKVVLPNKNNDLNMDNVPDETVQHQWTSFVGDLNNRNVSVKDIPNDLNNYFHKVSSSKDYQTTLNQINSINPEILNKWSLHMKALQEHRASYHSMPHELGNYILAFKSPEELVKLFFEGLGLLNDPIPTPSPLVVKKWEEHVRSMKSEDIPQWTNDLLDYLYNASKNPLYQQQLNFFFEMDQAILKDMQVVFDQIMNNYNMKGITMPMNIRIFLNQFDHPKNVIRSMLAALTHINQPFDYGVFKHDDDLQEIWAYMRMMTAQRENNFVRPTSEAISHYFKFMTKNTVIESDVEQFFDKWDANVLIIEIEDIWAASKKHHPHDFRAFFGEFLTKLNKVLKRLSGFCPIHNEMKSYVDLIKNTVDAHPCNRTYLDYTRH